jgi:hypothetical protein
LCTSVQIWVFYLVHTIDKKVGRCLAFFVPFTIDMPCGVEQGVILNLI